MPIGKQESTLAFYREKEMYRQEQNGITCQTYSPHVRQKEHNAAPHYIRKLKAVYTFKVFRSSVCSISFLN
jgi:hypothetical protein